MLTFCASSIFMRKSKSRLSRKMTRSFRAISPEPQYHARGMQEGDICDEALANSASVEEDDSQASETGQATSEVRDK